MENPPQLSMRYIVSLLTEPSMSLNMSLSMSQGSTCHFAKHFLVTKVEQLTLLVFPHGSLNRFLELSGYEASYKNHDGVHLLKSVYCEGSVTLPQNSHGSSKFCKGLKVQGPLPRLF